MNEAEIRARAEAWKNGDPDAASRDELQALLDKPLAETDLADRFAASLEFGTAGLRGVLGAGPNRMNHAVVRRTTFGLAEYLKANVPGAREKGVVIGFDGRTLSREFAADTACVLAAAGVRAHLFDEVAPTPLTSFAVKERGAVAGVMVTASHNPREYNGYKVYWTNSAQIIPPIDAGIAAAIDKAPLAKDVPIVQMDKGRGDGLIVTMPAETTATYLAEIQALGVNANGARDLSIVYTAMHGVGNELAMKAFATAGFTRVESVAEQAKPDATFPTVAFPNPEEKGAMDLSMALARKNAAELVVANDPDADRLAVAVPYKGSYLQFSGNQVGILLGHYLLTEENAPHKKDKRTVLASIVSSPMLGHICTELGVHYEETLTGFKWIANRAMQLEASEGYHFVFGYEEALGYTVGDLVRDKDGISAARMIAEMAAVLKERGSSLIAELEAIHRQYGLFVSEQVSLTKKGQSGAAEIQKMMEALRKSAPKTIGTHAVTAIRDFETGLRTDAAGKTSKVTLPQSNVLLFELEGGHRIIARPSGTEPKVKFYFDVKETVRSGESMDDAEARAKQVLGAMKDAFVKLAGG